MISLNRSDSFLPDVDSKERAEAIQKLYSAALDLAELYVRFDRTTQAIKIVEELHDAVGRTEACIAITLADLYVIRDLDNQAEAYKEAIELASAATEPSSLAVLGVAQAELSQIEARRGDQQEADRLSQETKAVFESLEDQTQEIEIEESQKGFIDRLGDSVNPEPEAMLANLSRAGGICNRCRPMGPMNRRWNRRRCILCPSG